MAGQYHHHQHLFAQNTIKIDNGYVNEQDRKAHCALNSAHNITNHIRVDCAVLELSSPDADRQEIRESGSLLCAIHEPTPRRGYVVVVWTLCSLQRTNQLLPNKDLTYLT